MENRNLPIISPVNGNLFLIDWLTVTFQSETPTSLKLKIGLGDPSIDWISKVRFRNGYPVQDSFMNISILWGADDPTFYKTADKARNDMGICLDMSGQGCRAFEEYSDIGWFELLEIIFRANGKITRLDLAYDDHTGVLDLNRIRYDVEDRNYVSKSTKSHLHWSDDQKTDIRGLTIYIGSNASPVLIRIYNKAAEREFDDDVHWVRVELRLRDERAQEAAKLLFHKQSIGIVSSGILRNYLTFRVPSSDSNKSRWPIAYYWQQLLSNMEKLSIWQAPGEPYNFSKSEQHFFKQYAQFMITLDEINHGLSGFLLAARKENPVLHPKYQAAISAAKLDAKKRREERRSMMREWGLVSDEFAKQYDFADILVPDPDNPFDK